MTLMETLILRVFFQVCDVAEVVIVHGQFSQTSGCPWPKAIVKSPVGAHDLRPPV
jgi:hypothetical protein